MRIKRYNIEGGLDTWTHELQLDINEDTHGRFMEYDDIEPLLTAVQSFMRAKGRFHTEASYRVLERAVKDMEANPK